MGGKVVILMSKQLPEANQPNSSMFGVWYVITFYLFVSIFHACCCCCCVASLPGMWERTITIGSAGKTFHVTGWRVFYHTHQLPLVKLEHLSLYFPLLSLPSPISPFLSPSSPLHKTGWAIGPAELIKVLQICNTQVCYAHVSIIQEAIAIAIETELARFGQPDSYFVQTNQSLLKKRDDICVVLKEVGLTPIVPEAGYLVLADTAILEKEFDTGPGKEPYDFQFAKWLIREKVFTNDHVFQPIIIVEYLATYVQIYIVFSTIRMPCSIQFMCCLAACTIQGCTLIEDVL